MSDELSPAIIKRTQNTLGKYVKKPSLTEKLLKKPPFRFLHDVFNVVIRDTKCFAGLYTSEELNYDNIKDRDDKMKFLQKMIDVVKLTTGSTLAVKTSKIVAGHEPEKTNELLQLMGDIIENNLDWQTAVEQVISGETSPRKETSKKSTESTKKGTKDSKSKEKSKETESTKKVSKATKITVNKTAATLNKDDNTKKSKMSDKTSKKLVTKDRNLKVNRETEKSLIKSANTNPKLTKSDSQSSNKSNSISNTNKPNIDSKSMQKEGKECIHDGMGQEIENFKTVTLPRKLSIPNANAEISIDNLKDSPQSSTLEVASLSADKPTKPSPATLNSSTNKLVEVSRERAERETEQSGSLEMGKSVTSAKKKSDTTETETMSSLKQDSVASSTNLGQQPTQKYNDSGHLNKASPHKSAEKPAEASLSANLMNEMKRESTFTRENSKESTKSAAGNRPRTSLRPPSARPPSARPGAPRRRDKNIEIILQPNDQIKMSGIQVKLETFGDLDDDGENLVIIENPNADDVTIVSRSNFTESEKLMQDGKAFEGHLVQQILETQKELVQQQNDISTNEKTDMDGTNNSVVRQTSARHINNLRDVIQNLTKSVNPLGKLMDFIPEDIDAMQLEFTLWRDAYIQAANELKREKSLTESATEPMKNQLVQIEANIVEYMEIINSSRVKILHNSEKIYKILTS